jgi:hypothetical protein
MPFAPSRKKLKPFAGYGIKIAKKRLNSLNLEEEPS